MYSTSLLGVPSYCGEFLESFRSHFKKRYSADALGKSSANASIC